MATCSSKRAYDIKCNTQCRTKTRFELEDKFGPNLNSTLYRNVFGQPCKFPLYIGKKAFHGCVWSDIRKGPWCYTELQQLTQPHRVNETVEFRLSLIHI